MNLPNQDQREQREDQGYRVIFGMLDDDCIRRLSAAIDGILVRGADVDAGQFDPAEGHQKHSRRPRAAGSGRLDEGPKTSADHRYYDA